MSTIEFKKFVEKGAKVEHSIKSALGRINKSIREIDDYLNYFIISSILYPLIIRSVKSIHFTFSVSRKKYLWIVILSLELKLILSNSSLVILIKINRHVYKICKKYSSMTFN